MYQIKSRNYGILLYSRENGHLQKALAEAGQPGFDIIFENRADINLGIDLTALGVGGRIVVQPLSIDQYK